MKHEISPYTRYFGHITFNYHLQAYHKPYKSECINHIKNILQFLILLALFFYCGNSYLSLAFSVSKLR